LAAKGDKRMKQDEKECEHEFGSDIAHKVRCYNCNLPIEIYVKQVKQLQTECNSTKAKMKIAVEALDNISKRNCGVEDDCNEYNKCKQGSLNLNCIIKRAEQALNDINKL
jgi:hypothetical protein